MGIPEASHMDGMKRRRGGLLVLAVASLGIVVARVGEKAAGFVQSGPIRHERCRQRSLLPLSATTVVAESATDVAPWEVEEETEPERQERYKREADEMKMKWDARRLEERQSAERRRAFAAKEQIRARLYGPRDLIMEAYEARMYEEARVLEVRRRQREVYERTKAMKQGKPLPPKGKPYVELKPLPVRPPPPEDYDVSGRYIPEEDLEAAKYFAPESYVSPTGPAPPPAHLRGPPKAAWEDPPYGPSRGGMAPRNYPKPGTEPPGGWPNLVPNLPPFKGRTPVAGKKEDAVAAKEEDKGAEEAVEEAQDEVQEAEVAAPAVAPPAPAPAPPAPAKAEAAPAPAPPAPAKAAPAPAPEPAKAPARAPPKAKAAELPTEEQVLGMKVQELKDALKKAGQPTTGVKKELQERLLKLIKG